MLTFDLTTIRRFVLGRQGLWPGRRWQGTVGTLEALRAVEYLQLDPLSPVARSHDLQLASRVLDYRPGGWEGPTYADRAFFDWGAWLSLRPMEEFPHWKTVMAREPGIDPKLRAMARDHADAIAEIRTLLAGGEFLSNRDFDAAARKKTQSYRGGKDSGLALHYLWRTGEAMIHHRDDFERVYARTEAVVPPALLAQDEDPALTDRFLVKKEIAFAGVSRLARAAESYYRGVPFDRIGSIKQGLLDDGAITEVKVEGWKPVHFLLTEDLPLLDEVAAGRVPRAWAPRETSTTEEAVFLAPLDPVSARGRAQDLFGFEYLWEVYKPVEKRRWGYYTLPVLWGDRLVARFESRFDRTTATLVLLDFWPEDPGLLGDESFGQALVRGFGRFLGFLGGRALDPSALGDRRLRTLLDGRKAP